MSRLRCISYLPSLHLIFALAAAPVMATDPLTTMREFCRADGLGDRLRPHAWASLAPLVTWQLEPAWDHVILIRGYEIRTPRRAGNAVEIEVVYTVSGEVLAGQNVTWSGLRSHTYVLDLDPETDTWHVRGPPPAPHVFESKVDREAMAKLLDPKNFEYMSASLLVWQTLRESDSKTPFANVAQLSSAPHLEAARTAQPGDVALYYDGDVCYHAGIVESDREITSATLNAGVLVTPFAAFAGEIRYRRLKSAPAELPTPNDGPPANHP
jgi:hypothetical protein